MKIGICGGTGLIGKVLVGELIQQKHEVVVFTRKKDILREFSNFIKPFSDLTKNSENSELLITSTLEIISSSPPTSQEISELDGIINLVGEPILGARWTEEQKQKLRSSRVDYTKKLVEAILESNPKPKFFFSASAVGYYGMWEENILELDENSPSGGDFLAKLCLSWEQEAQKASEFTRVVLGRIGIVLTQRGGALKQMLPAFQAFLGGKIANGKQYMSWIHERDLINSILFLVENPSLSGAFNLTAPRPVTNEEFSKTLASVLDRPCFFQIPAFALELIYGIGAEVVTKGQRVIPRRLLNSGFQFEFTDLETALRNLLKKA